MGNTYNTLTLTVEKKETSINIDVEDGEIVIEWPDDAIGNVVVNIGGKEQTVHVKNGKSVVDISDLGLGKHDVKVDYPGDGKHNPTSNSTTITVLKIDDYPIGENNTDDKLVISVPEDATGSVVVNMDGKNYIVPIKDGSNIANKITVRSWNYFSTIFFD